MKEDTKVRTSEEVAAELTAFKAFINENEIGWEHVRSEVNDIIESLLGALKNHEADPDSVYRLALRLPQLLTRSEVVRRGLREAGVKKT